MRKPFVVITALLLLGPALLDAWALASRGAGDCELVIVTHADGAPLARAIARPVGN